LYFKRSCGLSYGGIVLSQRYKAHTFIPPNYWYINNDQVDDECPDHQLGSDNCI